MRVLLDTNVVLDVLLNREPFVSEAVQVMDQVEQGVVTGLLCATTITTLACLAGKTVGKQQAVHQMRQLLRLFEVAPVTRAALDAALSSRTPDDGCGLNRSGPAYTAGHEPNPRHHQHPA